MSKPMFGDGFSTVVASAIRVMGDRLILVGVSSDENVHPVGRWSRTTLFGKTCDFFPVISTAKINKKYIKNLAFTLRLMWFWGEITAKTSENVITQNYMIMWWLSRSRRFSRRIFYFPGLGNQMLIGRKPVLGKFLYGLYEIINFSCLAKMDLVIAAASENELDDFRKTWQAYLKDKPIYQLPTAVDITFFAPQPDIARLKHKYGIEKDTVHFVCVGRLARVKGIDFLIDALQEFNKKYTHARLLVVGDGEERESLQQYVVAERLGQDVIFFGNVPPGEVRDIVNSADLCIVGSSFEGFSCAMVEQIACGKPLVSTDVSGASEIIDDGQNGFIVKNREPQEFATYMYKALNLREAGTKSRELAVNKYSEEAIWERFLSLLESPVG